MIRLGSVLGDAEKHNDAIYCPAAEKQQSHLVFFGGDVQDYPENMKLHRDNHRYIEWNLDSTALLLRAKYPHSDIILIKPSRMHLKTFSVYTNFVESNMFGVPSHKTGQKSWHHLCRLVENVVVSQTANTKGAVATKQTLDNDSCSGITTQSSTDISKGECDTENSLGAQTKGSNIEESTKLASDNKCYNTIASHSSSVDSKSESAAKQTGTNSGDELKASRSANADIKSICDKRQSQDSNEADLPTKSNSSSDKDKSLGATSKSETSEHVENPEINTKVIMADLGKSANAETVLNTTKTLTVERTETELVKDEGGETKRKTESIQSTKTESQESAKSNCDNDKRDAPKTHDNGDAIDSQSPLPVHIMGFSKGCVVLNQLLYDISTVSIDVTASDDVSTINDNVTTSDDISTNSDDVTVKSFMNRVETMTWLDGGHSGGQLTWINDSAILNNPDLKRMRLYTHVTPYQVNDLSRPWVGKEHKKFIAMLRRNGVKVMNVLHFSNEPGSLENHFQVIKAHHA